MNRELVIAAAQMGPNQRSDSRTQIVQRMLDLMEKAARCGAEMIVYPELALTTFFPRWYLKDAAEIDSFFETEMPGPETQPLFTRARQLGVAFSFGFAEKVEHLGGSERFNTSILVDKDSNIALRYRKIHVPGHSQYESWRPFQHLEKFYFKPGKDYFSTARILNTEFSLAICNDRRWPETYREMALRGAEVALIGYNTPMHYAPMPSHDHLQSFHNHLCMQAGAYQNGLWVVGVAKAGLEEGCQLLGQTCIIAPTGEIVAQASSTGDEVILALCNIDRVKEIRENVFNFEHHRRPEMYPMISATH
ncbi:N-carbamoyl-D-amino-acid hydrolase [Acetobacter malorum]|uniref:N-carbamoyl-D-amino acid hydrolase n=1 Tax=Acetobacter malorum TaxID=178901 RepID=A0A149UPI4_9PROT|nr:N-carbamoyl-D-amino-acid hydrolase [Acetobacter malorum]KXV69713.1 N-carbamoyl-D-amino acid hydrolase [Acetobacter malorum]